MSEAPERRRVEAIRARLEQVNSADWALASDGDGMMLEAVEKTAGGTSRIVVARFEAIATYDEAELLARAPTDLQFLLGLVDRALAYAAQIHRQKRASDALSMAGHEHQGEGHPRNYAAEAAMKSQEPAFKRFLMERHSLENPATDDRVAQRVRSMLGVTSRRELNNNNQATERWKALRSEFEAWRRAG